MSEAKKSNFPTVLQKQIITAVIVIAIGISIVFFVLMHITSSPSTIKKQAEENSQYKNEIETIGSKVDSETAWRYNQDRKTDELKQALESIQSEIIKGRDNGATEDDHKIVEVENLQQEIAGLRAMIGELASRNNLVAGGVAVDNANQHPQGIRRIKLQLSGNEIEKAIKNIEDTIPAGSFAKAVLLGGVDASTALTSSSDPRPLLIRLVDPGTLPRKFTSDLQDCHIVASGYGDLSSERVFARLEKLTCVERKSGEIVETEVAGYISGEDGRAGIKGVVIEKGRGYLAKSVLGGVLQGLAGVFNPGQAAVVSSSGAFFAKRASGEKLNEGMMSGASSSMDRLSKYYIERAESIQPVIQVASGRVVDVIFTEGSDIGTSRVKERLKIKREKQSEEVSNDAW